MARLGLAVDIGTSNLAAYIVDLDKPKDRFYLSIKNSQAKHGADVITRLTFARDKKNLDILQKTAAGDINNLIYALCKRIGINRKRIDRIVVSANTVMLHFLLGLNVSGLKTYPYVSSVSGTARVKASDIGIAAGADTLLVALPVISPYLGSDVTAGVLYTKMHKLSGVKFLLDLGTNAEMVLGNKYGLWATSAAAGPAFKGKEILLGSHMISAVAGMLRSGVIDRTGRLLQQGPVSQEDVRAYQMAKSAINAAFGVLIERSGISADRISKMLIAGLFGEKINIGDAVWTGLLPNIGKNKLRAIGNSSLEGAKMIMLNPGLLAEAESIAAQVKPVELSMEKGYQEKFISGMDF